MIRFDPRTKHFGSHLEDRLQGATLASVLVQEGNADGWNQNTGSGKQNNGIEEREISKIEIMIEIIN